MDRRDFLKGAVTAAAAAALPALPPLSAIAIAAKPVIGELRFVNDGRFHTLSVFNGSNLRTISIGETLGAVAREPKEFVIWSP